MLDKANKKNNFTKDKIIEIAEKLFSKYSYLSVTMDDIARELKITKPALYYHFKNKEAVFIEMTNRMFDEFENAINTVLKENISLEKRFRNFIKAYLDFAYRKKHVAGLMMQRFSPKDKNKTKNAHAHMVLIMSLIEPLIADIIKAKNMSKHINSKVATTLVLGGMNALVMSQLIKNSDNWNIERMSGQVASMVFAKK